MKNGNGQVITEWAYVVRGQKGSEIETLLGSAAAKRMNILEVHPDGKSCRCTVNMITESEKDNEIDRIKQEYDDICHGIGKFSVQEIQFHIDPSVMPVVQKQRPIPLGLRDKVEEHLKELLENDIIEGPLDSTEPHEWVSNAMITLKKESGQIRLNVEMRHVNLAIKPTHYALPTVNELRHQLNGATRFTKLDFSHAFHQIKLANKSRRLTTFYTHMGLFRFKRFVMGASPASQEFHEKFRIALLDLQGVLQIEDDLLIYGRTQSERNERLRTVLQRLRQIGVTLRKEKCQWNQESVIWFGYKFGSEGMSPDPAKVETIKQLPPPKNTTEVKSFLQMIQYNYMFLFDNEQTYADTTAPLRAMLQKGAKFVWTNECQRSFERIKQALSSETVVEHWSQNHETELIVDRGPEGISATLYQKEPSTKFWRPLTYYSRALKKTEKNYSPVEGESLAIKWGILVNKMSLHGIKFKVITDHQPLVVLYNNPGNRKMPFRVEKHRMKVQGFDFLAEYREGKSNPTDYNSRPALKNKVPEIEDEDDDEEFYVNAILDAQLPHAITLEMIRKATNESQTMA